MALVPGQRLGPYEIIARLGEGGMGEVWRARDTRLGRDVAIKTSHQQFNERFEREARAVAALNHPNVCHLYDVGPDYLVMELIEGETLHGPISVEETIKVAAQIASALEAAHERGIVHRDLKPANIKITPDGTVKVLDFGLARISLPDEGDPNESPTMVGPSSATRVGTILGTAAYMAPEQARGKVVDKRADIWAFGVVLYEISTGKRLFDGETVTDVLAGVLRAEPDVSAVPARLRRLIAKCLEKDPKKRLRDIGDWQELLTTDAAQVPAATGSPARPLLTLALAASFAAIAVVFVFLYLHARAAAAAPASAISLLMDLAPADSLGDNSSNFSRTAIAISPDGSQIVFNGWHEKKGMLYRRPLNGLTASAIPGTEDTLFPFFSPDGQSLSFAAGKKLRKTSLSGTAPVDLCEIPDDGLIWGGAWGTNGTIVFATNSALWSVNENGGAPTKLLDSPDAVLSSPIFLPDGKTILFTARPGPDWETAHVDTLSLADKKRATLLTHAADARYVPGGYLVFLRDAALLGVAFDAAHIRLSGAPTVLVPGIVQSANTYSSDLETGMGQFAIAPNGMLVYAPGGITPTIPSDLVRVDRSGKETLIAKVGGMLAGIHLSVDGGRIHTRQDQ